MHTIALWHSRLWVTTYQQSVFPTTPPVTSSSTSSRQRSSSLIPAINSWPHQWLESLTYLGVIPDNTPTFDHHFTDTRKRCQQTLICKQGSLSRTLPPASSVPKYYRTRPPVLRHLLFQHCSPSPVETSPGKSLTYTAHMKYLVRSTKHTQCEKSTEY